jgi:serine/threonine-protein kinase
MFMSTLREPLPKENSETLKSPRFSSPSSRGEGSFVAGTTLGGRYRLTGLLGRGGMGEVYKAEDLKLNQTVALKFLPEDFAKDKAALERFYGEVRTARRVSHPNVCRVFDIGEVEGAHFLSMEFIDGDDLSSLLRRIGRLPPDKAIEIARQLCAGIHAIHQAGVLHRDLKPANVIIDGRGQARITDFGIAGLAHELKDGAGLAGTPAYMSPEQTAGKEVTTKSDIYSLGLVLYEIFTGKQAFAADTLHELIRKQRTATPTSPSELVKDIDPLVEQVIFRCLEKDQRERPASALQVALALPGGNPLEAAIAAGETPTPEMVAAASKKGALRAAVAVSLLACVFVSIGLLMLSSKYVALHRLVPLDKSPEVLRERGREMAEKFGYPASDSYYGFIRERGYLDHLKENDRYASRWQKLATGQPAVYKFWYRQSPQLLVPFSYDRVTVKDPPNIVPGMAQIYLDTKGRLIFFDAVPPQVDGAKAEEAGGRLDWAAVFNEAGFNLNDFGETESLRTPPRAFDERRAWAGRYPEQQDVPIRVEAAAYQGRLVSFEIVEPWSSPTGQTSDQSGAAVNGIILATVFFTVLIVGSWLAIKNVRGGRSDLRGAVRVALFLFVLRLINSLFAKHQVASIDEVWLFLNSLNSGLFWAFFVGLLYLAFEPYLRKHAPERVISWNRLLSGDLADPLVGRDVLIGGTIGLIFAVLASLGYLIPVWLGDPPPIPYSIVSANGAALLGIRGFPALFLTQIGSSLTFAFMVSFLVLFFSLLLRRKSMGNAAVWLVIFAYQISGHLAAGSPPSVMIQAALFPTALVLTAARFGVLATVAMFVFLHLVFFYPFTTELSAWYATDFLLCAAFLLVLAIYGFYTSLAGQPLLKGKLLED